MRSSFAARLAVLTVAVASALLLIRFARSVEAQADPRPFGLRFGFTQCQDAMKVAGATQWSGPAEWSGTTESASPETLTPAATSAFVTCRAGKFDGLVYSAKTTHGPDPVGPQLIDNLLSGKWPRVEGLPISTSCGLTRFKARRVDISLDARPQCASYTVEYLRRAVRSADAPDRGALSP